MACVPLACKDMGPEKLDSTVKHLLASTLVSVTIAGDDREALLRVARYAARAPVAESRLRYDAGRAEVEIISDRSDGPYAGVHRMSALEFVARWLDHVPDRYETRVRYYGAYAVDSSGRRNT